MDRLGNNLAGRYGVEPAFVRKGIFGPHSRNHGYCLFPLGLGVGGIHLETVHLDQRGGTAGSQVHAAVAEDVQHRGAFGHADGVVVLAGQQRHGVAYADAAGALGQGSVQHLGGRAVGKFIQEVVLHGPEVVEPFLIGQFHLGHDLFVTLLFHAGIVGFRNLYFIHQAEFHRVVPIWQDFPAF